MKAVVYEKPSLIYKETEKPVQKDDEVLVKVHAASANALDYRSMRMGMIPKRKIFGGDIAGQVQAVGKSVKRFTPGDAVFGDISDHGLGGFAEYAAAPESTLVHIPAGVSFEQAAALPVASITALQALRDRGGIKRGKKVLINGAGGGVGTFAVQLAKYFGANVTAVCSSANAALVRSLGADHVIDYTQEDFTKIGQRYDLILAVNGCCSLLAYKRMLNKNGVCVIVGGAMRQLIKSLIFGPLMSLSSKKIRTARTKSNPNDLAFIIGLVEAGKIKPVIDKKYALCETAQAIQYLSLGHARGKVIINILGGTNNESNRL